MASKQLPPTNVLRQLFLYNPETGILYWKERNLESFKNFKSYKTWNTRYSKQKAGCVNGAGYINISIQGNLYLAHRIIWKMHYDEDPIEILDHINGDRKDNKICNLRKATNRQNRVNSKNKNKWGLKGVKFDKKRNKYMSRISIEKKTKFLGYYKTPEEAHNAYMEAAKNKYGEYVRNGD